MQELLYQDPSMPITAIAQWYGGKRTLAPRIIAELGKHRAYWEPFCGGISVILSKAPCSMETVNDLHGDLINLARVVADSRLGPQLFRRLRRTLFCEQALIDAREYLRIRPEARPGSNAYLEQAYAYFIRGWMGRGGCQGTSTDATRSFPLRFTANGGSAAKRFASAVDSIPAWSRRMRNVTILNRDGFELLDNIDDAPSTVIYLDPPYFVKGAKYAFDFQQADHERLQTVIRRFKKARVVVSYYDHPNIRDLYEGWTFVDCTMTKALVSQGARDKDNITKAPEVLIINGPSYTADWSSNKPPEEGAD